MFIFKRRGCLSLQKLFFSGWRPDTRPIIYEEKRSYSFSYWASAIMGIYPFEEFNLTFRHDNFVMTDSEFQKVSYKRKKSKFRPTKILENNSSSFTDTNFNLAFNIKRISDAKLESSTTDLYASVVASLKEGLDSLNNPKISKIICLGLGKIGECLIARYQFAIILSLTDLFRVKLSAYDPVFNERDKEILSEFGVEILTENCEGKYHLNERDTVLFYMPHCPKQLTNNLLWSNWGLNLKNCILIANSFDKIVESHSARDLEQNASYITKISPYVLELSVVNSFKYYEVFNDISIHVFPKLSLVCTDLWKDHSEPTYKEMDLEFITNELGKLLVENS